MGVEGGCYEIDTALHTHIMRVRERERGYPTTNKCAVGLQYSFFANKREKLSKSSTGDFTMMIIINGSDGDGDDGTKN